jgi:hypothetical protein
VTGRLGNVMREAGNDNTRKSCHGIHVKKFGGLVNCHLSIADLL